MKVLITGATGFVGTALREGMRARGIAYRSALHRSALHDALGETVSVGDIHDTTDWRAALQGISVVVHLAARAHVMRETTSDALSEFRRVNALGSEHLAREAARAKVRRLVYVSSIKVNGEVTRGHPFCETDPANPEEPYGVSKWEAETALRRVSRQTGLEVVIVRPPLVYGPGVPGNFLRLLKLANLGIPLPFGSARNLRSLIFVRNLADALVTCVHHPNAAGQMFLASDGQDLSTADICFRLMRALDKTPRLLPVPVALLRPVAELARRGPEFRRLFGSLQVDSSLMRKELAWRPPHTVDQGIAETVAWFRGR